MRLYNEGVLGRKKLKRDNASSVIIARALKTEEKNGILEC